MASHEKEVFWIGLQSYKGVASMALAVVRSQVYQSINLIQLFIVGVRTPLSTRWLFFFTLSHIVFIWNFSWTKISIFKMSHFEFVFYIRILLLEIIFPLSLFFREIFPLCVFTSKRDRKPKPKLSSPEILEVGFITN